MVRLKKKWGGLTEVYELSEDYEVRIAGEEDIPDILQLCRGNPMYYRYCPPQVSEDSIR